MAALDGLGAGVMGGMMGAMLGVMLLPTKISTTIVFILIVFVVVIIVLLKVIDEEVSSRVKKNKEKQLKKPFLLNQTFLTVLITFIAFSVVSSNIVMSEFDNSLGDFEVLPNVYEGEIEQQAIIDVKLFSYVPDNIMIAAGEPTVINFHADDLLGCSRLIYSNDLDFRINITPGESNFIEIDALEPGTYRYACTMNMYQGTITVY